MGFGTLFIGYFFLINISYFSYTDIIGGMVMLMGLYLLSGVNKNFKYAMFSSIAFAVFSFGELILSLIELLFSKATISEIAPYMAAMRYAIIFVLTLFILKGIFDVAKEVGANNLAKTAKTATPLSAVFILSALFEMPFIANIFGSATPYIYFALLLSVVVFIISNLVTIYKAYMQICMPEELNKAPKKSKFEFMNKFYDSIEEKSREYAEYKLTKTKNKNKKRKK